MHHLKWWELFTHQGSHQKSCKAQAQMSRPGSSVQHLRQTPTFAKEKNSINGYKDHEYICITGNNYYLFSPTDILLQWAILPKNIYNSPPSHRTKINEGSLVKPQTSKTLLCVFLLGWQAPQSLCTSLVGAKCAPAVSSSGRSSPPTAASDLSSSSPTACSRGRPANDTGLCVMWFF